MTFGRRLIRAAEEAAAIAALEYKCPACGGEPFMVFAKNAATDAWDVPDFCPHVCPVKADVGDYSCCLCCTPCMKENCKAEISGPVIPA